MALRSFFVKDLKFSPHLPLGNYPKSSAVQKNHNKYVSWQQFISSIQNCDKISCRKIALNSGFLSPKFIYISNLSSFLQLLALNKAYYLKIKVGLITASRQNLLNFAAILELYAVTQSHGPSPQNIMHSVYIVAMYLVFTDIILVLHVVGYYRFYRFYRFFRYYRLYRFFSTIGSIGTIGTIGSIGSSGTIGSIGLSGSISSIGTIGTIGSIGSSGPIGSSGTIGSIGTIGTIGSIGSIGSSGTIGSIGLSGTISSIGTIGTIGSIGSSGPIGSIGTIGSIVLQIL